MHCKLFRIYQLPRDSLSTLQADCNMRQLLWMISSSVALEEMSFSPYSCFNKLTSEQNFPRCFGGIYLGSQVFSHGRSVPWSKFRQLREVDVFEVLGVLWVSSVRPAILQVRIINLELQLLGSFKITHQQMRDVK